MTAAPSLVLYGNSIFLAGLKADLARRTRFDLLTIDSRQTDARERIRQFNPSVVIFDLATAPPDFAIQLLRDRPDLLLLGVDPSSDEVMVLSGRSERALSTQELVSVIDAIPGAQNPASPVRPPFRMRQITSVLPTVMASRQRKFTLAVAAIAVFVVVALALSLPGSNAYIPLAGAAVAGENQLPLTAFGAGIVLGAALIAIWFHQRTHNK